MQAAISPWFVFLKRSSAALSSPAESNYLRYSERCLSTTSSILNSYAIKIALSNLFNSIHVLIASSCIFNLNNANVDPSTSPILARILLTLII